MVVVVLPFSTVLAGTYVDIGVTAQGIASGGIANFTIVYVSETRLDLSWISGANVTAVMVRAKYGAYPNDITSENETPSDGYLVYYGSGDNVSDTSMNFDENPGGLYYRLWAQQADGTWVITPQEGWKESAIMTLIAIFGLAVALSFIAYKSYFYGTKILATVGWIGALVYWINNRPSSIAQGASADVVIIFVLSIAAFVFLTWAWFTRNNNGREEGAGFKISLDRLTGRQEPPHRRNPNREDRILAYQERLRRAERGER
jgi:hypothetical protein